MDIGHDTMGTIIINSYAFGASVSAVSDLFSKDDSGNGAAGDDFGATNSRITVTIGGFAEDDVPPEVVPVSAGDSVTLGFNGNWTGTETSIAWTLTEADNPDNLVTAFSPTSGTSAGFDPVFTINGSGQTFHQATYEIELAVTNSAGTTTTLFIVDIAII